MDYIINSGETNQVAQSNPLIALTVFLYHPSKDWNFLAGTGVEFDENHNFFVMRIGMGYEFELLGHWDFAPEIVYDLKDGHINSLTIAIGVGKRF